MVWFNNPHDISTFTPAWAFLIFPLSQFLPFRMPPYPPANNSVLTNCLLHLYFVVLVGIVAINVLRVFPLHDARAINILLVGYVFQGLGFFMTFFYLGLYVLRIMTTGFLEGHVSRLAMYHFVFPL